MHPKDPPLRFVWAKRTGLLTSRRSPEVEVVLSERMAVLDCIAGVRVWVCEMVEEKWGASRVSRPSWHGLEPSLTHRKQKTLVFSDHDLNTLAKAMIPTQSTKDELEEKKTAPTLPGDRRQVVERTPQAFCEVTLRLPAIKKSIPDWRLDMNLDDPWFFPLDVGTARLGAALVDFMRRPAGERGEVPDWDWLHQAWGRFPTPSGNLYPDPRKVIRLER